MYFSDKKRAKKEASKEPWFEILSHQIKDDGIVLNVDWNKSFIELLKKKGYTGINDDQLIDQYLYTLFKNKVQEEPLSDTKV
jgi:hypothetical protein